MLIPQQEIDAALHAAHKQLEAHREQDSWPIQEPPSAFFDNPRDAAAGRLRVYADTTSIWFTINASWDGTQWVRDSTSWFSGGFRFSRSEIEFLHENSFASTFTTWTRTWTLPMSATTNSAFETTGTIQEIGRVGMEGTNTYNATRTMALGGCTNFRSRFPATPSSITLNVSSASGGWSGTPSLFTTDRDGFGYFDYQTVSSNTTIWWFGTYTAVA
ncbi:MAG: hypothetical protein ACYTHK_19610 [Planctomycetota bacterium]|jgi:hypothetical protein